MFRLLTLAMLASTALAQVTYFSAALEGAQEVPPVPGAGRGWAVVRLDQSTSTVRVFTFYEALTGAPSAAHLHLGAVGVNGAVIVPLAPAGTNAFVGTGPLTAPQMAAVTASGTYVNVHTALSPGGEIRGQVVPSTSTRFTGVLGGGQEVPPTGSAATGEVVAYLHQPENRVIYLVSSSGLAGVTAAHIHQAAAGVNGPVIQPLNGGGGNYCGVTPRLTAAELAALLANGMYVNIHTGLFPGGEIRAQLLADVNDHFVAQLVGTQEVPPTPSPGFGGASVILQANGTIVVQGQFAALSGPPSAAHVHFAPPGVNGGVTFPLTIAGSSLSAVYTPVGADLTNLRAGNWYINVHTAAFPGGEIRGQLRPGILPTTFGEGCRGSNAVRPQIGAIGMPVIGTSMRIQLYGALPGGLTVFSLSPNRDSSGVVPLPAELTLAGIASPNCFVLVDPSSSVVLFADALGCAGLGLNVPLAPGLRGASFYGQWFVFDAAASPGGLVTSSAITLLIQ